MGPDDSYSGEEDTMVAIGGLSGSLRPAVATGPEAQEPLLVLEIAEGSVMKTG